MISRNISDEILFIGPSVDGKGGISMLLSFYSKSLESFNHIPTYKQTNKLNQYWIVCIAIFKLIYFCLFKKVKIIHIHSASRNSFFRKSIFVLISKFFNKKVILHLHGGAFEYFYNMYPVYTRFICRKSDCLIAVSTYFYLWLKKMNLNNNIHLLYNMAEHPLLKKKEYVGGKLEVLFLGSIENNKGIFDVLNCIRCNKEYMQNNFVFHICGKGNSSRLNSIIKTNKLSDFVIYHGWINDDEKNMIISKTDIYIQPSYLESFGISILEAMQYGIPIIGSNVGGIPDLVKDKENGYLINPGDMEHFLRCLVSFVNDKSLLNVMGEKSYIKSKEFSQENIQNKLKDIYMELLNNI